MKKTLFGSLLLLLAVASSAHALVYDCDMKSHSPDGFVPSRIVVSFEEGDDRAIVVDGYILEVKKAPIAAALKVRSPTSYKLNWELADIPLSNSRSTARVRFTAVLHTDRRTLSISATLAGWDNGVMRGQGNCKILKDK